MFSNFNLFGGPFERQPTTSSVQLFISTLNCISNGVYGCLVTTKTTSPLTPPWGFQHYKINWTECLLVLPFIGQKGKKKDLFFFVVVLCYMYGSKYLNQKKREQQFVAKIINNDDDDNAMCRFLYFKIRLMFFP